MPFTLDVGCGPHARGDVNVDVAVPSPTPHRFVLASAEHLPFVDCSFQVVRSSYVIEHCIQPVRCVREHVRCATCYALIITDNSEWIGDYVIRLIGRGRLFHTEHCYRWTREYLANLLARLGYPSSVLACNLSPTAAVRLAALLGRLPRVGVWFYRDLQVRIPLEEVKRETGLNATIRQYQSKSSQRVPMNASWWV
jgi:ubiquinone/menaquinone biosynthesis C-methylase UbiE